MMFILNTQCHERHWYSTNMIITSCLEDWSVKLSSPRVEESQVSVQPAIWIDLGSSEASYWGQNLVFHCFCCTEVEPNMPILDDCTRLNAWFGVLVLQESNHKSKNAEPRQFHLLKSHTMLNQLIWKKREYSGGLQILSCRYSRLLR